MRARIDVSLTAAERMALWSRDALESEASGQRGNSTVRAHSASEDARNRAGDTRPEPGSSARDAQADRRSAIARSGAGVAETETVPETTTEAVTWSRLLDWYLEGWAEANLAKIFAATAHGYRFDDPLVGTFSRWSVPVYFEHLRGRFARAGAVATRDFAFSVRGPMDGPRRRGRLTFFREAPRLGLSGVTFITIGERGIVAESVAYDLNLASDVLRNPPGDRADPGRL